MIRMVEIEEELQRIVDAKLFEERMLEHPALTLRRTTFRHKPERKALSNNDPR